MARVGLSRFDDYALSAELGSAPTSGPSEIRQCVNYGLWPEEVSWVRLERLSNVPKRQQSDVLLASLHRADVRAIDADANRKSCLANACTPPQPAYVATEQLTDVHLQDGR